MVFGYAFPARSTSNIERSSRCRLGCCEVVVASSPSCLLSSRRQGGPWGGIQGARGICSAVCLLHGPWAQGPANRQCHLARCCSCGACGACSSSRSGRPLPRVAFLRLNSSCEGTDDRELRRQREKRDAAEISPSSSSVSNATQIFPPFLMKFCCENK